MRQKYRITENLKIGRLATFVPNKKLPVYNWFYYKEGFSRDLVWLLAEQFALNRKSLVLDPFCGTGTTQLALKQIGIPSIGYDALPIAVFAAQVKLKAGDYDAEQLQQAAKQLLAKKFVRPPIPEDIPPIMARAFSKYALEDVVFFRDAILEIADVYDVSFKNFFLLALATAAIKASWSIKDGAVIKVVKKSVPPVKIVLKRQIKEMMRDLKKFKAEKVRSEARLSDARSLDIKDESIDAVITSPPYLNQVDYVKAYALENFIVFGSPLEETLEGLVGLESRKQDMVDAYFRDMDSVLKELARVCKPKAKLALVVGNACFPQLPKEQAIVESDVLLAELAERQGFGVKKILVVNKRWCTRQKTIKIGKVRESIVFLEKS